MSTQHKAGVAAPGATRLQVGAVEAVVRPANGSGGGRPPVLLVPGMFAGAWAFERWQAAFAAAGRETWAVTLRGHGGPTGDPATSRASLGDHADDLAAVVARMAAGGAAPAAVGHSMGGLVVQLLAGRGLLSAMALACSAPPRGIIPHTPSLALRQLKYLPRLLAGRPVLMTRADADALAFNRMPDEGQRAATYARLVPESARASLELALGLVAVDAARVRCPVLALSATDDRFVRPAVGRRLAAKYGGRWEQLPGMGHMVVSEPGWERAAAVVIDWLASN